MKRPLRTLYLIRHAESVWNSERRVQGRCLEVPLSEEGRRQAQKLGGRLRTLPFDHVYCSNALRARETAGLALGDDRPLIVREELRELNLGVWEGRLISEIEAEHPGSIDSWYRDPTTVSIEGMEEMPHFRERVLSAMQRIIDETEQGDILVVSHGGVICTYLTVILNMSVGDLWGFSLPNASITSIVLDFRPRLRSFGDTAHLDGGIPGCDGAPAGTV